MSHLRGRPASRSSRYLGWKQFVAVVEQLVHVRAKPGFSRRKVRNKGGRTIGRRCLALGDRGFMAGRGRVSRCSLPLEARGLESRSPFCGGEGRLHSSDVNGPSLSMPDDKATRTFTSDRRGRGYIANKSFFVCKQAFFCVLASQINNLPTQEKSA